MPGQKKIKLSCFILKHFSGINTIIEAQREDAVGSERVQHMKQQDPSNFSTESQPIFSPAIFFINDVEFYQMFFLPQVK